MTDSTNNTTEAMMIHTKFKIINSLRFASVRARTMLTTCVSGKNAMAKYWMGIGISDSGKNVPLNRNIGVINKNVG